MRVRIAVPEDHVSPPVIDAALESVTRLNQEMIQQGQVPSWENRPAGIVWRPENMGDEHFDHAGTVLSRKWGDCDDLAPWKAASLRASGVDPGATARVIRSTPTTYHAIVQRSDGSIDDPSIEAGMRATRQSVVGGDDGETIHIMACDPHDGRVYEGFLAPTEGPLMMHCGPGLAVRKNGKTGGFEARCDVPIAGGHMHLVRAHMARAPRHHSRHVGSLPYALAFHGSGWSPSEAVYDSVQGALVCGHISGFATPADKYKLLATHAIMARMTPLDMTHMVAKHMAHDAGQTTAPTRAQLAAAWRLIAPTARAVLPIRSSAGC